MNPHQTPIQYFCQKNNLYKVIQLLCKNEDPNQCGASKIQPIVWAASHMNMPLVAVLFLFGARHTYNKRPSYPSLTFFMDSNFIDLFPEMLDMKNVCPVEFLRTVAPEFVDWLVPVAIRTQRLLLTPLSHISLKKQLYIAKPNTRHLPKATKEAVYYFLCCLHRYNITCDVHTPILKQLHMYSWLVDPALRPSQRAV